ncbi:thermonuclease family protein [Roseibium album]|uniref:thermonuclease family protein n=1 Tax=Roseibium album TaxID=311410 RepID=UPI002492F5E9|nr:thermonuclease family protein [Roseibium album]
MIRVSILTAAIFFVGVQAPEAQEWQSSVSRVIDGDTIQLSRPLIRIRLCGVDTPEEGQRGYHEATEYTKTLVAGKTVQCRSVGEGTPCDGRSRKKSGERFVAQCFVNGNDIAMALVREGLACAWPRFSGNHYVPNAKCVR